MDDSASNVPAPDAQVTREASRKAYVELVKQNSGMANMLEGKGNSMTRHNINYHPCVLTAESGCQLLGLRTLHVDDKVTSQMTSSSTISTVDVLLPSSTLDLCHK